ncbi:hypothetical protein NUKP66_23580 [Klebsiella variicola]|nr:hypothetical protein NUKP66_23580 [Klebsiella variicola]
MFFSETLRGISLSDPASAAPPGRNLRHRTRLVPDGATLIRPTASSREPLYLRPGKRNAAGQGIPGAIPAFVPDGATLIRPTVRVTCR